MGPTLFGAITRLINSTFVDSYGPLFAVEASLEELVDVVDPIVRCHILENTDERNTIFGQVWAFPHFPLHLFLVLGVEGISQALIYNAPSRTASNVYCEFMEAIDEHLKGNATQHSFEALTNAINKTAIEIWQNGLVKSKSWETTAYLATTGHETIDAGLESLARGAEDPDEAEAGIMSILGSCLNTLLGIAGFAAPESEEETGEGVPKSSSQLEEETFDKRDCSVDDQWPQRADVIAVQRTTDVFHLVYVYFLVSIGLVVMLNAIIGGISRWEKDMLSGARLAVSGTIGLGLSLRALIATSDT